MDWRTNEYKKLFGIRILDWPARSPDINPIENVWSWMKKVIRKRTKPADTLIKLEGLLENAWAKVRQIMIHTLIRSMTKRVSLVIKNNGACINY